MLMRAARILVLWLICGLIIGFLIWYLPPKLHPQYTAQAFIRVLSDTKKGSIIALIKHQNNLEALVDRDAVQKAEWFQHFGKTKDDRMAGAVIDLKKRINALPVPDSDLVAVSLTLHDAKEASAVLNETVDTFLKRQLSTKRKQIASKLMFLNEQQLRIQRDLDLAEQECDSVRRRYGYADLEQHTYPDPVTERLIDLQKCADNCTLEIKEVQFLIKDLNTPAQPAATENDEVKPVAEKKELRAKLRMLQNKFAKLQAMRKEAEKEHKELNLAKLQYAQRVSIRDERQQLLNSIKSHIEQLRTLHDSPEASGVQFVEDAVAPRQTDTRPWQDVMPPAVLAALIAGIVHILLTRQTGKKKPE